MHDMDAEDYFDLRTDQIDSILSAYDDDEDEGWEDAFENGLSRAAFGELLRWFGR
jgi:hypothetical protein